MSTELIEHYVDRQSFKSDTQFIKDELKSAMDAYIRLNSVRVSAPSGSTRALADDLRKLNVELENNVRLNTESAKVSSKRTKAETDESKAAKESAKAKREQAAAEKQRLRDQKEALAAAKAAEAQAKRDAKTLDELSNDYLILSKAYNEASLKAKNYALTLGENHPVTIQAVADAKSMSDTLKRVDSSVGQFNRNVGNYKDGFSGLGRAFTQVTRELSAIQVGMQTFLLGISNNLPILADELTNAKNKIKEMQEAGKPAPSLFGAITKAIFSWQTALSVGITLLTIYGPKLWELGKALFASRDAAKEAQQELYLYAKSLDEIAESTEKFLKVIRTSFGTDLRNAEVAVKMAQARGASEAEILDLKIKQNREESLLAKADVDRLQAGQKYSQLLDEYRRAEADYTEFLAAATKRRVGLSGEEVSPGTLAEQPFIGSKLYDSEKKVFEERVNISERAYSRVKEALEKLYDVNLEGSLLMVEREKLATGEVLKLRAKQYDTRPLEDYQNKLQEVANGDDLTLRARLSFREQAFEVEKKIIEKTYNNEVEVARVALENVKRNRKSSQTDILEAEADYNEALEKAGRDRRLSESRAEAEFGFEMVMLRGRWLKEQYELEKKANEDFAAESEKQKQKKFQDELTRLQRSSNNYDAMAAQELLALEKQYAKGKLKKEEYEQQKLVIQNKYGELEIRAEIRTTKKLLEIRESYGEDVSDLKKKLAELELQLGKSETEATIQALEARRELIKRLSAEILNVITTIGNARFENEKNQVQDQIDDIERRKKAEIDAINATVAAEEEKAARIAQVNATYDSKRSVLEQKQREIQQAQARFQKQMSIVNIISSTAEAIMAIYASKTTPVAAKPGLAALVGAIGAAQLATVVATPVPKYRLGTDNHKGGWAIINDGPDREVVAEPGKKPYLAQGTNVLADLDAGTKVYPSLEDFYKTNHRSVIMVSQKPDGSVELMSKQIRAIDHLTNVVKNKREWHINPKGMLTAKDGNNITNYINKNIYQ